MQQIIKRTCPFVGVAEEIRQDNQTWLKFTGTSIVYEQFSERLGFFRERIEVGAAGRAVRECDVRANINHNDDYLLGRTTSASVGPMGEVSLTLTEDVKGVHVVNYPPRTTYAANLAELLNRRDMREMSFRFAVPPGGDRWEGTPEDPVRVLTEIYPLYDVSFVAFPAYPQTSATVDGLLREAGIEIGEVRSLYGRRMLGLQMSEQERVAADGIGEFLESVERMNAVGAGRLGGCMGSVLRQMKVGMSQQPAESDAWVRELSVLKLKAEYLRARLYGGRRKEQGR